MAIVTGTNQDDVLLGEDDEADTISGGNGDDELRGFGLADDLFGGNGEDLLLGNAGGDDLFGEGGDDVLKGGNDDDDLFGGRGDDTLRGEAGDDELSGEEGRDILHGGTGEDILDGGKHDDVLSGGAGADLFIFVDGGGNDVVEDFESATSLIDVLDLTAFDFSDFNDVLAAAEDDIDGVVIDFGPGNGSVKLLDIFEADLNPD